jgi:hypothetical protein
MRIAIWDDKKTIINVWDEVLVSEKPLKGALNVSDTRASWTVIDIGTPWNPVSPVKIITSFIAQTTETHPFNRIVPKFS